MLEPLGPGFPWGSWPREMTLDDNREDLERHYIYPLRGSDDTAIVQCEKSHARLDVPLWRAVSEWLESDWPFASVRYALRA